MTVSRRNTPLFFLSFATAGPSDDRLVERFFHDLENEVRAAAGLRATAETGFLSSASLRLGADWWDELSDALGHSATFVALCSPLYFTSVWCGREWYAFAARAAELRGRTGRSAPVLLPVWWIPTAMPPALAHLQIIDRTISDSLHTDGLRKIMLVGNARRYREFVMALGNRIVETARDHAVPPARIATSYDSLPQAFPETAPRIPQIRPAPATTVDVQPPDFDNRFPRL